MAIGKVYILSRGRIMEVAALEPVTLEWERKGVPGRLTFDVIKDDKLGFFEGDAVRFDVGDKKMFFGYIFTKSRTNNNTISVTAYDQLRYFKNKDTYTFKGKTAANILQTLLADFNLKGGIIADTEYYISSRIEDNEELFNIVDNALSITTMNTGKLYVLYDDYGKINLRNIQSLKTDLLIDAETAESFNYISSIDENTYNQIKLVRENDKTKKREIFIAKDTNNQNAWGILQYTDSLQEGENGKNKADTLLALYNQKTRKLDISGVLGDLRIRGGSLVGVQLYLGDLTVANFMLVERVKHQFYESSHKMDLTLIGGEFIA